MDKDYFDKYQKKMFLYRYKFFLLGRTKDEFRKRWTSAKFLTYRYWAETEEFDQYIVEEIGEFPNQREKSYTITLNLLLPEAYLVEEINKFKEQVLIDARIAKKDELKTRCESGHREFLNNPPGVWEFYKKQDIDEEKAQQTFGAWDRILTVYELHQAGKDHKEILAQEADRFSHLSSESNNANKSRRIREDIKAAEKLIESAYKGTFPITD
jgi:hypothetical protein